MNWMRQVLHVARKDIGFAKWYFATYAALVAVFVAMTVSDDVEPLRFLVSLTVLVATPVFVAIIVQNDSALAVDAFWATRPLYPTAVLAAKVLAILVGMTLPAAIGQGVILYEFGLRGELPGVLTAGTGTHFLLIGLYAAVAALTPTIGAYLTTGIVAFLAISIFGGFVVERLVNEAHVQVAVPWLAASVLDALPIGLLCIAAIHLYRSRNKQRSFEIAGLAALSFALLPFVRGSIIKPWTDTKPDTQPLVPIQASVHAEYDRGSVWASAIQRSPDSSAVIRLYDPEVRINGRRLDAGEESWTWVSAARAPLPAGFRWLDSADFSVKDTVSFSTNLSANPGSGGNVMIDGLYEVKRPTVVGVVPFTKGTKLRAKGIRLAIESITPTAEEPVVLSAATAQPMMTREAFPGPEPFQFVLINRSTREAVSLGDVGGGSGSVGLLGGMGVRWATNRFKFGSRFGNNRPAQVDANWLASAELMVVRWDIVRSDPVRLTYTQVDLTR
jgi:hypothetical protein